MHAKHAMGEYNAITNYCPDMDENDFYFQTNQSNTINPAEFILVLELCD